jgi:alpha-glucoside transport system permease protein
MDRIIATLISIVAAVGGSAVLFIGANKLFDLARSRYSVFGTVVGGLLGFLTGLVLWANNVVTFVEGPLIGSPEPTGITAVFDFVAMLIANTILPTAIGAVGGWLLAKVSGDAAISTAYRLDDATGGENDGTANVARNRLLVAVATTGLMGLVFGYFYELALVPAFEIDKILIWTVAGLAIGAGLWYLRGQKGSLLGMLALLGGIGWLLGTMVAPRLGDFKRDFMGLDGDQLWTIVAMTVGFAAIGAYIGLKAAPDYATRDGIARNSRVYIFLAPALTFIFASLLLPALRTIWLSFLGLDDTLDFADRAPGGVDKFIGFSNYQEVFADPKNWDLSNWSGIFGSNLFIGGVVLLAVGIAAGLYTGRKRGMAFERSGASLPPITLGVFLILFAVFAALRGTVFNNLWWVLAVVSLATSLGLAIAVLADRAKMENVAKSLIFMPMAISFVGAGIIWRFVYDARDVSREQTGVLNAIWVALGQLSNSTWPKYLMIALLLAALGGLGYMAYRGYRAGAMGIFAGALVTMLPFAYILFRLLTNGLGGFSIEDGEVIKETILVREGSPFNNVFLMVVLIWIQTGFTMVIFSAAIKAVPAELIEASKVDGATESQTFWRVTIPQITPTIGVVITTLIVLVMKVFDIVKVMTNGNFDTNVLANAMFTTAFTAFDFGKGSALAVLILLSVLPVMILNIRRMQKEAA